MKKRKQKQEQVTALPSPDCKAAFGSAYVSDSPHSFEDLKKHASRWRVGSAVLFFVKDSKDAPKSVYHFYRIEDIGNDTDLVTIYVPENAESKCWDSHEIVDAGLEIGHTEEQIEAALLLADWCELPISISKVAHASDVEYESWLDHAKKRRLASWCREARELKKLQHTWR